MNRDRRLGGEPANPGPPFAEFDSDGGGFGRSTVTAKAALKPADQKPCRRACMYDGIAVNAAAPTQPGGPPAGGRHPRPGHRSDTEDIELISPRPLFGCCTGDPKTPDRAHQRTPSPYLAG